MPRIAGITAERTSSGRATIIRLDVRKHYDNSHLQNFLKDVGFEVEPIKWTAKMKRAFKETEYTELDVNNFWGE